MRRTIAILTLSMAGLAALAGCALKRSKPALVYVLDATEPRSLSPVATAPVAVVGVTNVDVPGWLDRPQITRRAAGGQVVADEFARWGEPIARAVRRVVAENLAALLPERRVVQAPFVPGLEIHHRVDVTIVEAAGQPDGSVLLEARWAILGPKRGQVLVQRNASHRTPPTTAGAAGGVRGLNEALAALSRELAATLRDLPPPAPPEETEETAIPTPPAPTS